MQRIKRDTDIIIILEEIVEIQDEFACEFM